MCSEGDMSKMGVCSCDKTSDGVLHRTERKVTCLYLLQSCKCDLSYFRKAAASQQLKDDGERKLLRSQLSDKGSQQ